MGYKYLCVSNILKTACASSTNIIYDQILQGEQNEASVREEKQQKLYLQKWEEKKVSKMMEGNFANLEE